MRGGRGEERKGGTEGRIPVRVSEGGWMRGSERIKALAIPWPPNPTWVNTVKPISIMAIGHRGDLEHAWGLGTGREREWGLGWGCGDCGRRTSVYAVRMSVQVEYE